ncbi:hypothetical protein [Streptococcus caledonicus]|uniref:Phage protein n=1 Tax=Streptococcus caledonicus TaxID=2614158 RepID=A0ABW0UBE5_9STRE
MSRHSERLMEIYDKQGRLEDYKEELRTYIWDYWNDNLDSLMLLKEVSTDQEWIEFREHYLNDRGRLYRFELMNQEQLFGRLLEEILSSHFKRLDLIDCYEEGLKSYDPYRVRDVILDEIQHGMESVSVRDTYRYLISYLKVLEDYPDGKVISQKVATGWKKDYPRRKAMLEEFRKAGF